jgi:hypothetical protein
VSSGADFFLKKTLGEDFLQSLEKFELWKPGTKTVIDHEEIKTALKIVPRTLMSFIIHNLTSMNIGDTKELEIPVSSSPALLRVSKHERDVFSGELEQDNKRLVDFKYRSIPGVALVIMSALELYDVDSLEDKHKDHAPDAEAKIQKIIEDRLALHDLIGKVVDKKIAERDAIQQLVLAKLSENISKKHKQVAQIREIHEDSTPQSDPYFRGMTNGIEVANSIVNEKEPEFVDEPKKMKKNLPLNEFLEGRKKKLKKNEHPVSLMKGENVSCPDCGKNIFDGKVFAGCICFGDDMDKKLYITKSEDGVKVRFGKGWDPENIEMLLEVLRGKRG